MLDVVCESATWNIGHGLVAAGYALGVPVWRGKLLLTRSWLLRVVLEMEIIGGLKSVVIGTWILRKSSRRNIIIAKRIRIRWRKPMATRTAEGHPMRTET